MTSKQTTVKDLGWCIAKISYYGPLESAWLHIMSPANNEDNSYAPAGSVKIYSEENILKLRDFLNETFPIEKDLT